MPSRRRRRASPEWEGRDVITVAALPGRGLYVRHLSHPEGVDGVHRPTVVLPGSVPRPPATFDGQWLSANLDDVQAVHVHAVPPRLSPSQVEHAAALVHEAGKPLVVTLYHLTDPAAAQNHSGDDAFGAQLDALLPRADRVITLTESAADEVERRWQVRPDVLPHPHVVDFVRMRRERPARSRSRFVIGAHLGSLRFPADPVATVEALTKAAGTLPGVWLDVRVHDHLVDPESSNYRPGVVHEIERLVASAGGVLRAERPLTDPQLWDYLYGLDASFVPPLAGSHSIWPEACFDLGTRAIMPGATHAATQQPASRYEQAPDGSPDVTSLTAALQDAYDQDVAPRADPAVRWKERVAVAESLRAVYEELTPVRT